MKKMLLVLLFPMFMSCQYSFMEMSLDGMVYTLLEGVDFYDFEEYDVSSIYNTYNVASFISNHITYRSDVFEEWSGAEEFMSRGYGDCDDIAIAFANLAYITLGLKFDIVCVSQGARTIVNGGLPNHVAVALNGVVYSPTYGVEDFYYNDKIMYIYTFDEVFGVVPEYTPNEYDNSKYIIDLTHPPYPVKN